VIVEVDVEPLATRRPRLGDGDDNELGSDSLPGSPGSDHRVEDEGVHSTIPRDVDEADELGAVTCADPAQAVVLDLCCQSSSRTRCPKASACSSFTSALSKAPRQ
jgi:hypothetical protein